MPLKPRFAGNLWRVAFAMLTVFFLASCAQGPSMQFLRKLNLSRFAASERWIVFSVPLDKETTALAVIDRKTDRRKLVLTKGRFLADPRFSADGERLLVSRGFEKTFGNELLSCSPETWDCRILARAADTISLPVEIRKDVVLYSGGEQRDAPDRKRRSFDFYLVEYPSPPIRLSTFKLYDLNSIDVIGDKLLFSTFEEGDRNGLIFPLRAPFDHPRSEIFMLEVDRKEWKLRVPLQPLQPLFLNDGLTIRAAASNNGVYAVFLNTCARR